ncbi:MAG: hypothetical protein KAW00_05535 [Dehalococcoidia bacterium]|nr:hypothetical protein [Dehalococcoidia bacterium]
MNSKMTRGIQESGDSKARTVASLEIEPSATTEAEATLQSVVSSLGNPNFSAEELPSLMKMYMLSLRLLGIDDKWASKELKGYPYIEEVPKYRRQPRDAKYVVAKSGELVEEVHAEECAFGESVGFMVNHREAGWVSVLEGPKKHSGGRLVATKRREETKQWHIDVVLERIGEELFDRATKTLVTARFGAAIDTIFREYQKAVGSALSNLEIEDHLRTAYRNLKGGDEASWRAAALACRNVLLDISDKLWCVECDDYNMGGKLIPVKANKQLNRLRAYMHVKGLKKRDTPVALLDSVYAQASAAKTKCSYESARSVLIVIYLFLAELIRRTDMKPVTEIKKVSSKSKK